MKPPNQSLALVLTFVMHLNAADPPFTKVTSGDIAAQTGGAWGCSWGDYDDDGLIDLFVTNSGQNSLYRNNGDGTFARLTSGPIVSIRSGGAGAAWADYDNDGDLDLISAGFVGFQNAVYRNDGKGQFARLLANTAGALVNGGSANAVALADYDNDGWLDAFVANYNSRSDELFRGSPTGLFTNVLSSLFSTDQAMSLVAAWADYDNDQDIDLIVGTHGSNPAQRVLFYRNQGDGNLAKLNSDQVGDLIALTGSSGVAWGDHDNDGDLDVFVSPHLGHSDTLVGRLHRNNGDGTFTLMTNNEIVTGPTMYGAAWADYDNDGHLDLFVCNTGGHPGNPRSSGNYLYHNNGDGTLTRIVTGSVVTEPTWSWSAAWGDYDNDGSMDLFVANGGANAQANFCYRNNGGANHWLKLKLVGTTSNRSAIGAKIRVKAVIGGKSFWQLREISAGSGFLSQDDQRPNFGLGDATTTETVRIEWPSGIVQELHNVAANEILTVTEPAKLEPHVTQSNGLVELKVKSWKGFVYHIEASSALKAWTRLTTLTNETGTLSFADPLAGSAAQRFYRAVGK